MDGTRTLPKPDEMRSGMILAAIVLVGTLILAYARLPGPACYFRLLFHVPCPGCGLTRSMESLWHGDLYTSFRYHPLGAPIFAACVTAIGSYAAAVRSPRRLRMRWVSIRSVFLLFAAVWAIRLGFALAGSRFFLW